MALTTRDAVKIKLNTIGYTNLKDGRGQKDIIILLPKGGDRVGVLTDTSNKITGARYNPTGGSSSVGRVEVNGYKIDCKIEGGGGSGAGSDVTKLAESAQCVYNAVHFAGKGFTHSEMKSMKTKFNVDEQMKNILEKLPEDWVYSSTVTAKLLKAKFGLKARSYVHNRGSRWVDRLYAHASVLNKKAGRPFGGMDKWNPADIWMCTNIGMNVNFTSTETLSDLNELLAKNYESGDIVGVSLKKIKRTPKYKELNLTSDRPTFKYDHTTVGLRGFFESGDGYLFGDGFKAQFRRFGATWQAELKGTTANMGKMSGGPIKGLVDMIDGGNFIPQRELQTRDEANIKKFYGFYCAIPYTSAMTEYDFYTKVMEKDTNWFISKIMTTQIIARIEAMTPRNKDRFASGLANYAGSESELSGPYIKVYE